MKIPTYSRGSEIVGVDDALVFRLASMPQWNARIGQKVNELLAVVSPETRARLTFDRDSLRTLELWLHDRYGHSLLVRQDPEMWERVAIYIGETFRRDFGGDWILQPEIWANRYAKPEVAIPSAAYVISPFAMIPGAYTRYDGLYWQVVYDDVAGLVAGGASRLPLATAFQEWLYGRDKDLEEFILDFVKRSNGEVKAREMDYSLASLNHIDNYIAAYLQSKKEVRELYWFYVQIGSYLGETLRRHFGGRWVQQIIEEDGVEFAMPVLTDVPGIPDGLKPFAWVDATAEGTFGTRWAKRARQLEGDTVPQPVVDLRLRAGGPGLLPRPSQVKAPAFDAWKHHQQQVIDLFLAQIPEHLRTRLDFTLESAECISDWLMKRFACVGHLEEEPTTWDGASRYLAEILIRHADGEWAISKRPPQGHLRDDQLSVRGRCDLEMHPYPNVLVTLLRRGDIPITKYFARTRDLLLNPPGTVSDLPDYFRHFMGQLDGNLVSLHQACLDDVVAGRSASAPFYTVDSLDEVETYLRLHFNTRRKLTRDGAVSMGASDYFGETIRRNLGGEWIGVPGVRYGEDSIIPVLANIPGYDGVIDPDEWVKKVTVKSKTLVWSALYRQIEVAQKALRAGE